MRPPLRAALLVEFGIGCLVVGLIAGFVAGLGAGDFNARIDFCDDDTSGRFIADAAAREASCAARR